ncbi:MAG: hypothetical protein RLZZ501_922 [Pseudomonadota bacterium]
MSQGKVGKVVATALCLLWIGWGVWSQFLSLPADELENHSSLSVRDRLSDCTGTFQQRYDCKNAIVIATDRGNFFNVIGRILIIVLPPLLVVGAWRLVARPRDDSDGGGNEEWSDPYGTPRRRYHRRTGRH